MFERKNQIYRDDIWLLGNAKLIEYEVNDIKQCGIFYKGKEVYWHYIEKEEGLIDYWNSEENIYVDKKEIEDSKTKLFQYRVSRESTKKANEIVEEIKNTIDLSKEVPVNIDNEGYMVGDYKYYYIPKTFQKPYMFYRKMVEEHGYNFYNKALDISSNYYHVDRDKLEEVVRGRINSGKNYHLRKEE